MRIWTRFTDRLGAWLDRRLARQFEKLNAELEEWGEEKRAEGERAREILIDAAMAGQRLRARERATATPWSHPTAKPFDDVMDTIARIEQERGRP